MSLQKEVKKDIILEWSGNESLSGSTEAQIGLLTARITQITEHLVKNKHDFHSRQGLFKLIGKRKRFLKYLGSRNPGLAKKLALKIKG